MESRKDNINLLCQVFVGLLVMSNILSAKLLTLGPFIVPGGILCYALTFLMLDVIGERYGEEQAKRTVLCGLFVQIICALLVQIVVWIPGQSSTNFDKALQGNWWFTLAGLVAYIISQTIGVKIFHGLRNKLIAKKKEWKWLWENISTILSQTVDTIIFIGIAYGIGLGANWETIKIMFISQVAIKTALAIIDTPIFYLLTRRKGNDGDNY